MAGLFPSIGNSQNVDENGRPLANAVLTVYQGGTTALANVFQDIGLTIVGQNPMTADITGRLPLFYVADGVYAVRLIDQYGVQIYSYPQIASIGASSSGSGGGAVDPTTVFQTGDELFQKVNIARAGWVRQNGLTIGSAVSGGSERANADTKSLFLFLWNQYPQTYCPVVGGRGSSALADWAANSQITLPDMRGRNVHGLDGMGNARANIIPNGNVKSQITGGPDTGDTPAASGGEANHLLLTAELATHNHGVNDPMHTHGIADPTHNHGVNDPTHTHTATDSGHAHNASDSGHTHQITGQYLNTNFGTAFGYLSDQGALTTTTGYANITVQRGFASVTNANSGTGISNQAAHTGISNNAAATGISIQNTGGNTAHNTMSPFVLGTWYIKL